jgi:predicted MFS family arabinose efflux permease
MIVYIFGIMMTSLCREYYQFLLAQGILCGLATGFVFTPCLSVAGHYFRRKRGLAMGVITAGSSFGGIILPIALKNGFYSGTLKFAWSVRIVGLVLLILMAIGCALVKERLPGRKQQLFVFEAFRIPSYTLLVIAVFFSLWGMWIPYYYIITLSIERAGMDAELAFYTLPTMNGCSLLGRIVTGYVADKYGRLNSLPIIYLSNSILLFCWVRVHSTAGMFVWACFFGFVSGGVISVYPAAISMMASKPAQIGAYLGQAAAVTSFANLTGTPIAGALLKKHGVGAMTEFAGTAMIVASILSAISRYCWDRDWKKRV